MGLLRITQAAEREAAVVTGSRHDLIPHPIRCGHSSVPDSRGGRLAASREYVRICILNNKGGNGCTAAALCVFAPCLSSVGSRLRLKADLTRRRTAYTS